MTRSTTEDYRRLDVRELDKAGLLAAGRGGMWSWYSRGTLRASIQVQAGDGHVRLIYAATENGERKEYSYLVRPASTAAHVLGFSARREAAGSAWRSSTAAQSSPVGTATGWPTNRNGNGTTTVSPGARTKSGGGWAGLWAS